MGNNIMMPVLLFLQITRMHYLHPKVVDLISQPKTWYYALANFDCQCMIVYVWSDIFC
jgi:hypothetical protein